MNIKKKQPTFNQESFKVFDSKTMPYEKNNASAHFALTDALITYAGANEQPVLHFWQTPPLAILGMMDTRISHFKQALSVFDAYDHDVVIRNSGGLAVVSDPGVLFVLLIYLFNDYHLTIYLGYIFILSFIRIMFLDFLSFYFYN